MDTEATRTHGARFSFRIRHGKCIRKFYTEIPREPKVLCSDCPDIATCFTENPNSLKGGSLNLVLGMEPEHGVECYNPIYGAIRKGRPGGMEPYTLYEIGEEPWTHARVKDHKALCDAIRAIEKAQKTLPPSPRLRDKPEYTTAYGTSAPAFLDKYGISYYKMIGVMPPGHIVEIVTREFTTYGRPRALVILKSKILDFIQKADAERPEIIEAATDFVKKVVDVLAAARGLQVVVKERARKSMEEMQNVLSSPKANEEKKPKRKSVPRRSWADSEL